MCNRDRKLFGIYSALIGFSCMLFVVTQMQVCFADEPPLTAAELGEILKNHGSKKQYEAYENAHKESKPLTKEQIAQHDAVCDAARELYAKERGYGVEAIKAAAAKLKKVKGVAEVKLFPGDFDKIIVYPEIGPECWVLALTKKVVVFWIQILWPLKSTRAGRRLGFGRIFGAPNISRRRILRPSGRLLPKIELLL